MGRSGRTSPVWELRTGKNNHYQLTCYRTAEPVESGSPRNKHSSPEETSWEQEKWMLTIKLHVTNTSSCSFLPSKVGLDLKPTLACQHSSWESSLTRQLLCQKLAFLASQPKLRFQVSAFAIWHVMSAPGLIYPLMLLSFKNISISYTYMPYWPYKYQNAMVKFKLNIETWYF